MEVLLRIWVLNLGPEISTFYVMGTKTIFGTEK